LLRPAPASDQARQYDNLGKFREFSCIFRTICAYSPWVETLKEDIMDLSGTTPPKPIVDRAKAIILTPKDEWPVIAAETAPQGDILMRYVLPLAAIGPVAGFLGGQLFGYGLLGISFKPGLVSGLSTALISFALGILGIFVLSFIADFLAPKFGGEANRANAFKLVAYGATASWLAGIFQLIPMLGVFGLLGLYSIYLFYTGAGPLMKVPSDKAPAYVAVTILCAIVLALIITPITVLVTGIWGATTTAVSGSDDEISGTINLPGGGSVDLGKIQELGKQAEGAANGKSPPVEAARMQALLPAAIGPFKRSATESMAMGPMGSTAQATYTNGDKIFDLRIIDMSALGALAGLGAAMGVEQSREDADGYERTQSVDGQMQTESWSNGSNRGKFATTIANRFMIEAEGDAESIVDLKVAVGQIDPEDLTELVE
jgi:hypothetical protein